MSLAPLLVREGIEDAERRRPDAQREPVDRPRLLDREADGGAEERLDLGLLAGLGLDAGQEGECHGGRVKQRSWGSSSSAAHGAPRFGEEGSTDGRPADHSLFWMDPSAPWMGLTGWVTLAGCPCVGAEPARRSGSGLMVRRGKGHERRAARAWCHARAALGLVSDQWTRRTRSGSTHRAPEHLRGTAEAVDLPAAVRGDGPAAAVRGRRPRRRPRPSPGPPGCCRCGRCPA